MTAIIVTAIIASTFVWWWVRLDPHISHVIDLFRKRTEMLVHPRELPKAQPIPIDLMMEAMMEGTDWAREDSMKKLQEMYAEEGNWDNVRTRWGAIAK